MRNRRKGSASSQRRITIPPPVSETLSRSTLVWGKLFSGAIELVAGRLQEHQATANDGVDLVTEIPDCPVHHLPTCRQAGLESDSIPPMTYDTNVAGKTVDS